MYGKSAWNLAMCIYFNDVVSRYAQAKQRAGTSCFAIKLFIFLDRDTAWYTVYWDTYYGGTGVPPYF